MLCVERNTYHRYNKSEISPDFKNPDTRIIHNGVLYVKHITENTFKSVILRSPITADWYIITLNKQYEVRGKLVTCTSIHSDMEELYVTMDNRTYIGAHLIVDLEYERLHPIDLREIIPWDM